MFEYTGKEGGVSGVYRIRNKLNGKRYFGSSIDIAARWEKHISELSTKTHHSSKLQEAWDTEGVDAFEFEIILRCPRWDLGYQEQLLLDLKPEYNMCYFIWKSRGAFEQITMEGLVLKQWSRIKDASAIFTGIRQKLAKCSRDMVPHEEFYWRYLDEGKQDMRWRIEAQRIKDDRKINTDALIYDAIVNKKMTLKEIANCVNLTTKSIHKSLERHLVRAPWALSMGQILTIIQKSYSLHCSTQRRKSEWTDKYVYEQVIISKRNYTDVAVDLLTGREVIKKAVIRHQEMLGKVTTLTNRVAVVGINIETGATMTFPSTAEAARALDGNQGDISAVCRQVRESAKGVIWRFQSDWNFPYERAQVEKLRLNLHDKKEEKSIVSVHINTGEIMTYETVSTASAHTFIDKYLIYCVASHHHKSTNGFIFRYLKEWKDPIVKQEVENLRQSMLRSWTDEQAYQLIVMEEKTYSRVSTLLGSSKPTIREAVYRHHAVLGGQGKIPRFKSQESVVAIKIIDGTVAYYTSHKEAGEACLEGNPVGIAKAIKNESYAKAYIWRSLVQWQDPFIHARTLALLTKLQTKIILEENGSSVFVGKTALDIPVSLLTYINSMPMHTKFKTSEILSNFPTVNRTTISKEMCRLIKSGKVQRFSMGIYCRIS